MFENKIEFLLDSIREDNNTDIMRLISKLNVRLLTEEYQRKIDPRNVISCKILKLKQKALNNKILFAINELLQECEIYKLKPVFMKGIFLAADLYDEMETRSSHDIDILVSIDEFPLYYTIMKKLGYKYEYYSEEKDNYKYYLGELEERHLGYVKIIDNQLICIEIHIAIINSNKLFINIADEFIYNAKQTELLGLKPYVLQIEYNLVQLAIHFFKHLTLYYFQNMLFKREVYVNLSNIHDIALLQSKYKDKIDMKKVFDISKKMMIVKYIELVFIVVNKIYGELFTKETLLMYSKNEKYSQLDSRNSQRSGLGKLVWLLDIYVDYCKDITPKQFVLGIMPNSFRLIDISLSDKSQTLLVGYGKTCNISEVYNFPILLNGKEKIVDVNLDISLDSRNLEIEYIVKNKKCCYYEEVTDECYTKDSIEIIIIKNNYIIHRMLTVSKIHNKYSMVLYSDNTDKISDLECTEVDYKINIHNNGFCIYLTIPWTFLDVCPETDKLITFNVAGLISNPETLLQEKACNLFNKDDSIWNFQNINAIKFV